MYTVDLLNLPWLKETKKSLGDHPSRGVRPEEFAIVAGDANQVAPNLEAVKATCNSRSLRLADSYVVLPRACVVVYVEQVAVVPPRMFETSQMYAGVFPDKRDNIGEVEARHIDQRLVGGTKEVGAPIACFLVERQKSFGLLYVVGAGQVLSRIVGHKGIERDVP